MEKTRLLNEIIESLPGRKNIKCPPISIDRGPTPTMILQHDLRYNAGCYDHDSFQTAATQALIEDSNLNRRQAEIIVSEALERHHEWTDTHDYGNLFEEIQFYAILCESVQRWAGEKE